MLEATTVITRLFPYLARKLRQKNILRRLFYRAYGYTLWFWLNIILHILKPFKAIKIVLVESYGIGHLAYCTYIFLKHHQAELKIQNPFHLGIAANPSANQQLLNMYKREFPIVQNKLAYTLLRPLFDLKKSAVFESLWFLHPLACPFYKLDNTKPLLHFTSSEEESGRELLHHMGIDSHSWFVCFHARDPLYMSRTYSKGDWSYHNYRDCDIKKYLEAAQYIAECGGFAVRMGQHVVEKLPDLHTPRIIDYATKYRSDFGDIYLCAKAKFFLGSSAGLRDVPLIFGVSVAQANLVTLEHLGAFRAGDLFIPMKIWSVERKRFLGFSEIIESGVRLYIRSEEYTRAGLEVIENTSQEILDLAVEMNGRLDGTFTYTDEDEELQRRFRSLYPPDHRCYGSPVRIGAKFLRENIELLA